jgi:hypothetical protein
MTDATVLIIDPSSNILILSEPYSFLNTKIMPEDSPAGTNTDEAAKNAIVRIIKEKINFTIDKTRLTDINLDSEDGTKQYVFVYKINDSDKRTIIMTPNQIRFTFFPIISLPKTLVKESASIAVFITKEVNVLREIPDPPGIIFTYPTIINYIPLYPVPVLIRRVITPVYINTSSEKPKKEFDPISVLTPKETKNHHKKEHKPHHEEHQKSLGPIVETLTETSESQKTIPETTPKTTPEKKRKSKKNSKKDSKGGFHKKYLKYKLKYLSTLKEFYNTNI